MCSPASANTHSQGDAYRWSPQNAGSSIIAEAILTPSISNARYQDQPQLNTHINGPLTRYWAIFLENVHPLTKVVHAPSIGPLLSNNDDVGNSPSISSISRTTTCNALKYAICACAVSSLTDRECQATFGETLGALLYAFQSATRQALSEASFLRVPDMDLLCAHTLLLVRCNCCHSKLIQLRPAILTTRNRRRCFITRTDIPSGPSWDLQSAWLSRRVCIAMAPVWVFPLSKSK